MHNRRKTLWALLALFLFCLPALACGGQAMLAGCGGLLSSESGTVTDRIYSVGDRCTFQLAVEQDTIITVRMSRLSGELDPYLMLLDATGALLAEDDDSAGGNNALIENIRLSAPGNYAIVARSYGDDTTGEFELSVDIQGEQQ